MSVVPDSSSFSSPVPAAPAPPLALVPRPSPRPEQLCLLEWMARQPVQMCLLDYIEQLPAPVPLPEPDLQPAPLKVLRFSREAQRVLCRQIDEADTQEEATALRWRLVLAHRQDIEKVSRYLAGRSRGLFSETHLLNEGMLIAHHATRTYNAEKRPFGAYMYVSVRQGLIRIIATEQKRLKAESVAAALLTDEEDAPLDLGDRMPCTLDLGPLEHHDQLATLLDKADLSEGERHVLTHRYGLDGALAQTFQEIGEGLGVSRWTVRRIHGSALEKLQEVARILSGGEA